MQSVYRFRRCYQAYVGIVAGTGSPFSVVIIQPHHQPSGVAQHLDQVPAPPQEAHQYRDGKAPNKPQQQDQFHKCDPDIKPPPDLKLPSPQQDHVTRKYRLFRLAVSTHQEDQARPPVPIHQVPMSLHHKE